MTKLRLKLLYMIHLLSEIGFWDRDLGALQTPKSNDKKQDIYSLGIKGENSLQKTSISDILFRSFFKDLVLRDLLPHSRGNTPQNERSYAQSKQPLFLAIRNGANRRLAPMFFLWHNVLDYKLLGLKNQY